MNIAGQDPNTDYSDIYVLDFTLLGDDDVTNNMQRTPWYELRVGGTLPEVRYGGHGGAYSTGLSFWLGFGFNKKEVTGKRLGDTFRITFSNTSSPFDTYQ